MTILLNVLLGFVPTLVLARSIAEGTEDDAHHRRVFLLVYGLWALTLALWNWHARAGWVWIAIWGTFGVVALVMWMVKSRR